MYSKRDEHVGLPNVVWRAGRVPAVAGAGHQRAVLMLTRRSARVRALLDVRRKLVSEAMQADERHNRELSERLHDGPLQNLLAACLDLEDLRENLTDSGFDRPRHRVA